MAASSRGNAKVRPVCSCKIVPMRGWKHRVLRISGALRLVSTAHLCPKIWSVVGQACRATRHCSFMNGFGEKPRSLCRFGAHALNSDCVRNQYRDADGCRRNACPQPEGQRGRFVNFRLCCSKKLREKQLAWLRVKPWIDDFQP